MSKEEIALELLKITLHDAKFKASEKGNFDTPQIVIDLYNQIFDGIKTENRED